MLVAVFVFSIIMTIAVGAIFSIVAANKTSQALKSVMDNLSSALDTMSRDARYGTMYHCGNPDGNFKDPTSCLDGDSTFAFVARPIAAGYLGEQTIYTLRRDNDSADQTVPGTIYKCANQIDFQNQGVCVAMTAPEVHITKLNFYVQGAEESIQQQPSVFIAVSGYATAGTSQQKFEIETLISQRNLDTCKVFPNATSCQ